MRILLLSAYHAASHALWAEGLMRALPEHNWTLLSLPPRNFSWRVRGNSLSWALLEKQRLCRAYDLIVATSMTDLSALKGLRPELASVPAVLYFHENQFAYPASAEQLDSLEPKILSIYSALAADRLLFNSDFNRRTFIAGAEALLKKMPDFCPLPAINERLANNAVLPVGLSMPGQVKSRGGSQRLHVLWNHRWEYDKGPERLLALLQTSDQLGLEVDFSIVGQQFRQQPEAFAEIARCLRSSASLGCVNWGYLGNAKAYNDLLGEADLVLSTAIHDFQGLAVLEAVAAGCRPLLPRRLCYQEWFGEAYFYDSYNDDIAAEAASAARCLGELAAAKGGGLSAPDVSQFAWSALAPRYTREFAAVAAGRR